MDLRLHDQVAFVAGSSRGIGKAIATALLAEGAKIVLTGRDQASLDAAHAELSTSAPAANILALAADFTAPAASAAALDRAARHFGRIDHLIANLGSGSSVAGHQIDAAEWQRVFALNFFAGVHLAQAAVPHLEKSANPSVLFIGSIVALDALPAPLPYSAAKAALHNYAKNLAMQLAAKNIRVNTLAPGNIFFPGGNWERIRSERPEAVAHMLEHAVPQHRFGTPEEIAALAAFLCSPLSAFTTGACFVADGGQTRSL